MDRWLERLMQFSYRTDPEGGGGGGGGNGDPDPDPSDPNADPDPDKTFTQEELNRKAGRARDEGRRAAEREVSEKLGVSIDEAADIIKAAKAKADEQKSEAEREREAAEREKTAAAAERAEAAKERHFAKLERALLAAEVPLKRVSKAVKLLEVEVGADDDAIEAAIEELEDEWPELFEASEQEERERKQPRTPHSDIRETPPRKRPTGDAKEKAKEIREGRKKGQGIKDLIRS